MSPRPIYLDNAASTPVLPAVLKAMAPYWSDVAGNPSSLHAAGRAARKAVEDARDRVAARLGASPKEIVFTSGGTESDNLAVLGAARAARARGRHVVTASFEHPAVLKACVELEEEGFQATYLDSDVGGRLPVDRLAAALRPDTVLVSVMAVNNETGIAQPIREIGALCRKRDVLFHTDAVQAAGKLPLDVEAIGCDLLSITAHKIHGPKGAGCLYARRGTAIRPILAGGEHEWGRRPGTETVPAIVGLAAALDLVETDRDAACVRMAALRDRLEAGIAAAIPEVRFNGDKAHRVCSHLHASFRWIDGEALLLRLDADGLCVSAGSACASGSLEPSHVLKAMGLDREWARGSLRFSLGRQTTAVEIDGALTVLAPAVARLRSLSPLVPSVR